MKITDFINGKVEYDKNGSQYFWIIDPKQGHTMLGELRGWGAIQKLFNNPDLASEYQDQIGQFIAEAINEKIEREKLNKNEDKNL